MADLIIAEKSKLTSIADSIRETTGHTDSMTLDQMATEIEDMQGHTVRSNSTVDDSTGVVTTTFYVEKGGYLKSGEQYKATRNLSTQAAATITPSTSAKTAVAKGKYTTGVVKVVGDADLKAANIKKDVTIFNVTGTYTGESEMITVVINNSNASTSTKVVYLNSSGLPVLRTFARGESGEVSTLNGIVAVGNTALDALHWTNVEKSVGTTPYSVAKANTGGKCVITSS